MPPAPIAKKAGVKQRTRRVTKEAWGDTEEKRRVSSMTHKTSVQAMKPSPMSKSRSIKHVASEPGGMKRKGTHGKLKRNASQGSNLKRKSGSRPSLSKSGSQKSQLNTSKRQRPVRVAPTSAAAGNIQSANSQRKPGSKRKLKKNSFKQAPSMHSMSQFDSNRKRSGLGELRDIKRPSAWTRFKRMFFVGDEEVMLEGAAKHAAELLELTQKQLRHLKLVFHDIDVDNSGRIDYDEFFKYIDEVRSPFSDALFALIDLDGSGTIDFNEFVQVLTTYCMFGKDDILRFAFDAFDTDASGTLDEEEFVEMCVVINNGNPTFAGNFNKVVEEFDRNDDGLIDIDEFRELNRRYPLMIFPAFRMQDRMQKATLGERAWIEIQRNKAREQYVEEYMKAHNGAYPPEPLCEKIARILKGKKDPRNKYTL